MQIDWIINIIKDNWLVLIILVFIVWWSSWITKYIQKALKEKDRKIKSLEKRVVKLEIIKDEIRVVSDHDDHEDDPRFSTAVQNIIEKNKHRDE